VKIGQPLGSKKLQPMIKIKLIAKLMIIGLGNFNQLFLSIKKCPPLTLLTSKTRNKKKRRRIQKGKTGEENLNLQLPFSTQISKLRQKVRKKTRTMNGEMNFKQLNPFRVINKHQPE